MLSLPPLNALKYFEAAARTGSYVKAAAELSVTPAAVSQQVRLLETFYRRKLFTRFNNRIVLSDAGQAIYAGSAPALEDISLLSTRFLGGVDRSTLVVSVLPSLAECWFVPQLAAHGVTGLGLKLDLRVEDDPVDFAAKQIDLRITYGGWGYPDLQTVPLFRDEVIPFCSPQFHAQQLAQGRDLSKLPDAAFIHTSWGPSFASHPGWNDWFLSTGQKRHIDAAKGHRTGASRLALDFARFGFGVALGQRTLADYSVQRGELVALATEGLPLGHDYCAVYPQLKSRKAGLQQLLALMTAKP